MDENLIHEHFPHRDDHGRPTYRKNQFELIRDSLQAFEDDSIEDVVVEAPTGAGKTSIAVTVARIMTIGFDELLPKARFEAKEDVTAGMEIVAPRQAHLITSMKMLQNAYLQDDKNIRLVKGKGNYDCHKNPRKGGLAAMSAAVRGRTHDFSCDEAEQMYGSLCKNKCPYKDAREDARWAPIALHNFDSFLHQVTLGAAFTPRRLLTVDEAHNAEEKLRNFMSLELSEGMFASVDLPWALPMSEDIEVVTAWVGDMLADIKKKNQALSDELGVMRRGNMGLREIERMSKLVRSVRMVEGLQTKLDRFYKSRKPATDLKPASWVSTITPAGVVSLEPVDAGRFVPAALLRYGQKRLHMSATFLNSSGGYKRSVNLRSASTYFLSAPSTFPVENRLIHTRSAGKLGARDWDANFPKAVEIFKQIMDENPGVRGVLHCTSYSMSAAFAEAMDGNDRIVAYQKENRDAVVNRFMSGWEYPDGVLLAVALSEGYDFKGDLCRFQILTRIPYPVPTKCMRARMDKDGRFYGWRTSLTLVQTYGRGVRAPDDFCKTYVLDERFTSFVSREDDQLPPWFMEAIQ